jgi:methylase of polypeptide subunit release factors
MAVFERRVAGKSQLETLIKLLLIGQTLKPAEVRTSLGPDGLAELAAAGIVEVSARGVRATVRLLPHGDIVVACDRTYHGDRGSPRADLVTGVTSPAILLADLTIRKSARSALDLGTGGGIQALLLAKHSERVVAVDINPRALDYARLNAGLNGIQNIEVRLGSWFEPVAGERFDIVTANPPYVMSPDTTYLYRDSGMKGDSLCRQIVRAIPEHLEEGGFGHVLISWAIRGGEEWSAPLRRWIEGLPCDVWLLHYLTEDPLTQAGKWNQGLIGEDAKEYGAALDRWTEYYRREGIDQIGFGAVVMRRRSDAPNWVRADTFRAGGGSSAGLLARVFEAEDFLQALGDDGNLLDEKFALVPEHRLEQSMRSRDGVWQQEEVRLTLTQGISFTASMDRATAQLVQELDGRRTLRQAVSAAGRELGLAPRDVVTLAQTAVGMARRLHQLGFLVRSESPGRAGPARPAHK